ncbi:MAG: YdcF family protein [Desulfosoma sp.]
MSAGRLLGILALLFALEGALFVSLLGIGNVPGKADAVVVFAGAAKRIQAGWDLVRSGAAPKIAVSPALPAQLSAYAQRFGPLPPDAVLPEPRARTTFENALLCREIIRDHGLKRVILVTSAYHAPRSYLLLKALTWGSGVDIALHAVTDGSPSVPAYVFRNRKILYNEMLKLWGSLAEGAVYALRGKLPADNPKMLWISRSLREILLCAASPDH